MLMRRGWAWRPVQAESRLLAAAIDTRIAVAVPERGVQSFKWARDHSAGIRGRDLS